MTVGMRKGWLIGGVAAIVVVFLAYAWIDGGREPVRSIAVPVAVPEAGR